MSNGLQFVFCNPAEGRDAEFNQWYGEEHLPHVLQVPGILGGQRFERVESTPWPAGKHRYLTIWDLDDPHFALESLAEARKNALPISEAIDMKTVQPPTMWLRARVNSSKRYTEDSSTRPTLLVVMINPLDAARESIEHSTLTQTLPLLADVEGVIRVDFLTLAEQQIRGSARKYQYALLFELADESKAVGALRQPTDLIAGLPGADPERSFAAVFRPLVRRSTRADFAAS